MKHDQHLEALRRRRESINRHRAQIDEEEKSIRRAARAAVTAGVPLRKAEDAAGMAKFTLLQWIEGQEILEQIRARANR